MRRLGLLTLCLSLFAVPATASAADFTPAPGTYTADTTTLKLTGTGVNVTGVNQGGVAVFNFDDVTIAGGVTINASGSRPLKIAASGDLTMSGTINGNGQSSVDCCGTGVVHPGGPGGGAGGTGPEDGSTWTKGLGPGGGGIAATQNDGGGGGGFGGKGARGGINGGGGVGGAAGAVYGNLNTTLQGGSGGAGSGFAFGGGGGGAIALFGNQVTISGVVFADGGGGAVGAGASAGGSGGGILVHGDRVDVTGALVARGGDGGRGGCCGDGGGGGGGRIAYQYRTLGPSGTALINGGLSGARSTTNCCTGTTGDSLDPAGAVGLVTKAQAASSTTSPATGVSQSSATLNGTVNPHKTSTRFYFDFGTTTGYGTKVPSPSGAPVGSDNVDHPVGIGVGGLSPSTTYHYRLVAVDSAGFTTFGTDIGFTTAAAPPPVVTPPPGGGNPTTVVPSTASINSLAFPKFTKLVNLSVKNLQAGSTVLVSCKTKRKKQQKKGCPYKRKRFTTSGARASLNLRKPFKNRKVPVGTKITITITSSGFLGKRITYTIRARKLPKSKVQCLSASGKAGSCA